MDTNLFSRVARLTDGELLSQVKVLVRCEREATARVVAHLAELEDRNLHLAEGCSSLFTYCTQVLHLSEHAAYNRIEAARAARKFPCVLGKLADGSVHLTAIRLIAPHMTAENHVALLQAVRHRGKREIEEVLALLRPRPAVPSSVRRMPAGRGEAGGGESAAPEQSLTLGLGLAGSPETSGHSEPTAHPEIVASVFPSAGALLTPDLPAPAGPASITRKSGIGPDFYGLPRSRPSEIVPLSPEAYRVQFTATRETQQKLRQAQELLGHQIPGGEISAIIDMALTLLVEKLQKQKFGGLTARRASRLDGTPTRNAAGASPEAPRERENGGRAGSPTRTDAGKLPEPGGPTSSEAPGRIPAEAAGASPPAEAAGATPAEAAGATPAEAAGPSAEASQPPARSGQSLGHPDPRTSRHIPISIRQLVWQRDGGQCAYRSPSGRRCTERGRLEFHHVKPFAAGGVPTAENLELRCRAHNGYESMLYFGSYGPDRVREESSRVEAAPPAGVPATGNSFRNEFEPLLL